jgi:hypothetical protein
MKRAAVWLVALASLGSIGCEGRGHEGDQAAGEARARGALVAKVDGAAIGLDQVRELVARGLTPRVALQRLEEEQLLAREAARRGYGRADLVEHEVKRALVQALLAETVERIRPEDIPLREVQQRFDEVAERNHLAPERFAEQEREVRKQLVLERRKAELDKLTATLRDRIGVQLSEAEVDRLLSDPAFWGEGS